MTCHHPHHRVMPDSDEHENDIYEDEEVELSDDDPPPPKVSLKGHCDQNIKNISLGGGSGGRHWAQMREIQR